MARDYTKYSVVGVGQNLNKRQLVGHVVRHWAVANNASFEELSNQFPDSIQGNGFIRKVKDIDDPKRFDVKNPIVLKYEMEACVSNQWGKENVAAFIAHIKGLGYAVEELGASPEVPTTSELPDDYVDAEKMPLPEHLQPDWDLNWGTYVHIYLDNDPEMETVSFGIVLSLGTLEILGAPKRLEQQGDRRWFTDDAFIHVDNLEDYQSSCNIRLHDADYQETCEVIWHGCLEEIDMGELPDGLTEDRFNEIFNGEWFSALYHHIKQNLHHRA